MPLKNDEAKDTLRKGLETIIKISYETSLAKFLDDNPLADELFFIHFLEQQQTEVAKELQNKVDFFEVENELFNSWYESNDEKKLDDWYKNKLNKDSFWYYREYQIFLQKRLHHLSPSKPKEGENKTKQGEANFKNNFDGISPTAIYEHFKAGLVEKGYLTDQELNEYFQAAFELKTIPKTLFKIKNAPKKAVIEAVFYNYYRNVAGKTHGKQPQYAALLGDYFEGYKTKTISSNFSKSVY